MNDSNLLLGLAVIAVVVSVIAAGFTYLSIASLTTKISGLAIGTANLTVETQASINFTTAVVNWGSGKVNDGQTQAHLSTVGAGSVSNGNWTAATGLILENNGNSNVSLNITVGKNASNFIGGTGSLYFINVSDNEVGACTNASGFALGLFYSANTSNTLLNCNSFRFDEAADAIRIDFNITIPENSLKGALGDIITATATAL
ncbi:hypothetical protein CO038_03450 [Candidatus Pacearchaeota archaeon CG_4_9_14_0_2_um_filter_39_13]|nr:hypothetical protein [Candidatus Pacearchaeota archaeon]OIO44048.1 MAG: hypothetical protein AUJ64_00850 [Candidatus Pacearchaeota archaeon CG1_02_39_14]PJC44516.1 MAG: hypothetical protein CO038_03450 [Candidatus Pacearchaeota archaeon CG_4_9_14_0_2_um_filter_39_13]QBM01512.1 hypothetical protein [uncultured archaeon]